MNLLLDSHVLLWSIYDPEKLTSTASEVISSRDNVLYLSDASLWELSLKIAKGKLEYESSQTIFRERIKQLEVQSLAINRKHILVAVNLPPYHADPFDRMLIAQVQVENMVLVSYDRNICRYEISVIW